ncbi:hypothetical protein COCNU_scaffold000363G000010 [Cocos nucifera]|nr:hypothetical protein [Cocos nucifera]
MEEFKASSKMKDLNIAFSQKSFIKDFILCEGRVVQRFPKLDLSILEEELDEEVGSSGAAADPSPIEVVFESFEPIAEVPKPMQESEVISEALIKLIPEPVATPRVLSSSTASPSESPIDAELLPQGISLKLIVRNLKKKVQQLRKKLKKIEDELQKSRKNASEATIEVTHLCKLHVKDSMTFIIKKDNFERELVELKKSTNDVLDIDSEGRLPQSRTSGSEGEVSAIGGEFAVVF